MIRQMRFIIVFVSLAFLTIRPSSGFRSWGKWQIHQEITVAAIGDQFTDDETLVRILLENKKTDGDEKINNHALHFDNEAFAQSTQRLANNLDGALGRLADCDKPGAIIYIGEALHALQDFYSHSNWVEMNLWGPSDGWPISSGDGGGPFSAPTGPQTHNNDNCSNASPPGDRPSHARRDSYGSIRASEGAPYGYAR